MNLGELPIIPPATKPRGLRRRDREVDVPGHRLVRELVGDLDFEPIIAFRERRQRHGLSGLQLMPRRGSNCGGSVCALRFCGLVLLKNFSPALQGSPPSAGCLPPPGRSCIRRSRPACWQRRSSGCRSEERRQLGLLRELHVVGRDDFHQPKRVGALGLLLRTSAARAADRSAAATMTELVLSSPFQKSGTLTLCLSTDAFGAGAFFAVAGRLFATT